MKFLERRMPRIFCAYGFMCEKIDMGLFRKHYSKDPNFTHVVLNDDDYTRELIPGVNCRPRKVLATIKYLGLEGKVRLAPYRIPTHLVLIYKHGYDFDAETFARTYHNNSFRVLEQRR